MAGIILHLTADTENKLREKDHQAGQTLEAYLERLAQHEAESSNGTTLPTAPAAPTAEEWSAQWRAWAAGHAVLPAIADDSRESIYAGPVPTLSRRNR